MAWSPTSTPMSDVTKLGDTFYTKELVDNVQVCEGQSHAHYLRDDSAPETREVFGEISGFFNKHMGK